MSHLPARVRVLSHRQAWPWRWEMALLEIGCRDGWLLPSIDVLSARARELGERLRTCDEPAALAFEGYTLVGACWRADSLGAPSLMHAFVMPAQRSFGLDKQLFAMVQGCAAVSAGAAADCAQA